MDENKNFQQFFEEKISEINKASMIVHKKLKECNYGIFMCKPHGMPDEEFLNLINNNKET